MKKLATIAAAFFLLLPAALALAGGAGGVGFSGQYYHASLSTADLGMTSLTGFGYGVGPDGSRIGGFGTAFFAAAGRTAGGVGGMLVGHEWQAGPIVIAFTLWGGVGGAAWGGADGTMLAYGAAQAELGYWILPWMQLTAFVGYEAVGNVIPGPFSRPLLQTPVVGLRIAWGGP